MFVSDPEKNLTDEINHFNEIYQNKIKINGQIPKFYFKVCFLYHQSTAIYRQKFDILMKWIYFLMTNERRYQLKKMLFNNDYGRKLDQIFCKDRINYY